jgi:hypothetical protein
MPLALAPAQLELTGHFFRYNDASYCYPEQALSCGDSRSRPMQVCYCVEEEEALGQDW